MDASDKVCHGLPLMLAVLTNCFPQLIQASTRVHQKLGHYGGLAQRVLAPEIGVPFYDCKITQVHQPLNIDSRTV